MFSQDNVQCTICIIISLSMGVYSSQSVLCRLTVLRWDNGGIFLFNESLVIFRRWFNHCIHSPLHVQTEGQCVYMLVCALRLHLLANIRCIWLMKKM